MSKMKNYLLDQYENQQGGGQVMREYQINKVESYYVKANSSEEARALVAELDNSSAHKVTYEAVWAGSEEGNNEVR